MPPTHVIEVEPFVYVIDLLEPSEKYEVRAPVEPVHAVERVADVAAAGIIAVVLKISPYRALCQKMFVEPCVKVTSRCSPLPKTTSCWHVMSGHATVRVPVVEPTAGED